MVGGYGHALGKGGSLSQRLSRSHTSCHTSADNRFADYAITKSSGGQTAAFQRPIAAHTLRYKTHLNVIGWSDGTISLDKIALVNNATGVGPTFIRSFERPGNLEGGLYIRHDYGSKYDQNEFYHGYKACFSGPRLVPVPQSWTDAASKRALVCENDVTL
jgi:hypothetical protein